MYTRLSNAVVGISTLQLLSAVGAVSQSIVNTAIPGIDTNTTDYYLEYQNDDFDAPWAHFWTPQIAPLSDEFGDGLLKSPHAAEYGVPFEKARSSYSAPGYELMENGYTILDDGSLNIAIRSEPKVITGEMLDWWFYWHMNSTTKYKLWNPSAHRYSAVQSSNLSVDETAKQTFRERYWNKTYSINEYIGNSATTLSIGFFDASNLNFTIGDANSSSYSSLAPRIANNIETLVAATSTLGYAILDPAGKATELETSFSNSSALLMHQLRQKPDGSGDREIRSRFWFGAAFVAKIEEMVSIDTYAKGLAAHCHIEMTHLGEVLPGLFYEFRDNIST